MMFVDLWDTATRHLWDLVILMSTKKLLWRHQMEAFSVLLALCAGNSPVIGEFRSQRTSNADFDIGPHKLLNKQSNDWWFQITWLSCDVIVMCQVMMLRGNRDSILVLKMSITRCQRIVFAKIVYKDIQRYLLLLHLLWFGVWSLKYEQNLC